MGDKVLKRRFSVYMDEELLKRLEDYASSQRLSVSWIINKLVYEKIEQLETTERRKK